jgi:hypothetical protein
VSQQRMRVCLDLVDRGRYVLHRIFIRQQHRLRNPDGLAGARPFADRAAFLRLLRLSCCVPSRNV